MDQPREVAKPARGQKNKEIKCTCRYISGMYMYMYKTRSAVCIYMFIYQVQYIFYYLGACTFVHSSLLYMYVCETIAVYVCMYVCMYK